MEDFRGLSCPACGVLLWLLTLHRTNTVIEVYYLEKSALAEDVGGSVGINWLHSLCEKAGTEAEGFPGCCLNQSRLISLLCIIHLLLRFPVLS